MGGRGIEKALMSFLAENNVWRGFERFEEVWRGLGRFGDWKSSFGEVWRRLGSGGLERFGEVGEVWKIEVWRGLGRFGEWESSFSDRPSSFGEFW